VTEFLPNRASDTTSSPQRPGQFGLGSLFRLGSVPGSREDIRRFQQGRLRTYLAFVAIFWPGAGLVATSLALLVEGRTAISGWNGVRAWVHAAGALLVIGIFFGFGRREHSERWLAGIDFAVSLLQGLLFSLMLVAAAPIIRYRPDTAFQVGLAYCLIARAAVVPSSAKRTLFVCLFVCVPVWVATFWVHTLADRQGESLRLHYQGEQSRPFHFLLWGVFFSTMSTGLATFVSHVIYGLQRQVQRARRLGQYTLETQIGEGGMGIVYRARHALLRRPTAVKLLPKERAGVAAVARFEREVQATSQLCHPNTVAIYDYGRTPEGVFYYAMEYLDGIDLQDVVDADGPQSPGRVVHLLRQIGGALGEAHARGIVHRDVKPSNVVLCERALLGDMAKVLDFGLARDLEAPQTALSQTGAITGTPLYMSPEQVQGHPVDGRSDLYAVGALGYFLITGQPVFAGKSVVELCAQHLHAQPVAPSLRAPFVVPEKLEQVLLCCLEKDPANRPASARALLAALDACDDCPRWTEEDAFSWWRERGNAIRASKRQSPAPSASEARSLTVALRSTPQAQKLAGS
jgi:eukaryotic-like serine/threonine-protein kinase